MTTFSDSLTKYSGLYYHFLDGYINPNAGSTFKPYEDMLLDNKHLTQFNYSLLSLGSKTIIIHNTTANIYKH